MTAPAPRPAAPAQDTTFSTGCGLIALVVLALFLLPFAARVGWRLAERLVPPKTPPLCLELDR